MREHCTSLPQLMTNMLAGAASATGARASAGKAAARRRGPRRSGAEWKAESKVLPRARLAMPRHLPWAPVPRIGVLWHASQSEAKQLAQHLQLKAPRRAGGYLAAVLLSVAGGLGKESNA